MKKVKETISNAAPLNSVDNCIGMGLHNCTSSRIRLFRVDSVSRIARRVGCIASFELQCQLGDIIVISPLIFVGVVGISHPVKNLELVNDLRVVRFYHLTFSSNKPTRDVYNIVFTIKGPSVFLLHLQCTRRFVKTLGGNELLEGLIK